MDFGAVVVLWAEAMLSRSTDPAIFHITSVALKLD